MKRISRGFIVGFLACILHVRTGADEAQCGERISPHLSKTMAEDRRINDDAGKANQFGPSIAWHRYGLSVAAWPDSRNGGNDIYFQLFNRRGLPFGTLGNVQVNDAGHGDLYMESDVAMDGYGNFMVVWSGGPAGVSHVYGQWYLANGRPMGGNVKIDETDEAVMNVGVAACGLNSGGAVVVWTDRQNDAAGDLMFLRFGRGGVRSGSDVAVDPESDAAQVAGAVSSDLAGNFTVVWQEGLTDSKIMARRFDSEGRSLGNSFQVAPQSDPAALSCSVPALAVSWDGAFAVIWMADYGGGDVRRQARLYDPNGNPVTGVFRVDEPGKFNYMGEVGVAALDQHVYAFVWSGNESGDWNIYLRPCDPSGVMNQASRPVNNLPGRQMAPDVAVDAMNNLLVVWNDNRNTDFDIYGAHLGSDMPNSLWAGWGYDGLVPLSWEPPFGVDRHERYLIYRTESISEAPALLATVDAAARPLPDRMLDFIDTTAENGRPYYYAVRVDGEDTGFNIAGPVTPSLEGHVIASAWSGTDPTIDGSLSPDEWEGAAVRNISENYHYANVLLFVKNTNRMLYLAVVDSTDLIVEPATVLGMLFDLNHDGRWAKTGPSNEGMVAVGPAGAVFWGYWGSYPDHLGGDPLTTVSSVEHAISGGSGVTVYEVSIDLSANPYPVSGGMTIGFAIWVTDPGNFYGLHYGNAAEWPVFSLWEAAESLGELTLAAGPNSVTDKRPENAEEFDLGRNYPNPFNPSTTIPFRVKEPCRVTLKVYNAAGKETAVLADGNYAAGNHQVRFDASGLPAGIYVYRLNAGEFSAARKLAVVK